MNYSKYFLRRWELTTGSINRQIENTVAYNEFFSSSFSKQPIIATPWLLGWIYFSSLSSTFPSITKKIRADYWKWKGEEPLSPNLNLNSLNLFLLLDYCVQILPSYAFWDVTVIKWKRKGFYVLKKEKASITLTSNFQFSLVPITR